MKRLTWTWDTMLLGAVVAMAGVCAQTQQYAVAQEQEELEGRIVEISPAVDEAVEDPAAPEAPAYWIGLRGRGVEDPVLRTQLQLAEDMGVVVEDVVPESPAEKAGLRKHDIILRSNDDVVDSMAILQQQVQKGGEKPIELQVLRLGKEITVTVTPEKRPENFDQVAGESAIPNGGFQGELGQLMQQLQGGAGLPGGLRVFGPGMVLNGGRVNINALPNGMSVSINRSNDGPAQITVKQGDKTWTVSSDDAKAIAELPEEVRNFVTGMLHGQGGLQAQLGNFDWEAELRHMLPDRLKNIPGMAEFKSQEDELAKRMQQLEEQIKALQERLEAEEAAR